MSKKTNTKTETAPAERDVFAEALALQATMAATAAHFQTKLWEQTAGFTFEIFDFVNDRLAQDVKAAQELGHCDTVDKAFETLGAFQQKALEDYTCETARLSMQSTFSADAIREEVAEDVNTLERIVRGKAA